MEVQATFLGEPRLIIDNAEYRLTKKKLEALLFYLLYHETADRSEVASVFWPQKEPVLGKASLRNSLYEIRRILGMDLFEGSTRDRIQLSSNIHLSKDVDRLLDRNRPLDVLEVREFRFLHKRELKSSDAYEEWLASMRSAYEDISVSLLKGKLEEAKAAGDSCRILELGRRILLLDPYNEQVLRLLMQTESDLARYHEALSLYRRTAELLKEDLGIEPEPDSVKLATFIQQRKSQQESRLETGIRHSALLIAMHDAYRKFLDNGGGNHLLITGDPGSGRKDLIQAFLADHPVERKKIALAPADRSVKDGFYRKWATAFNGTSFRDLRKLPPVLPDESFIVILEELDDLDHDGLELLYDVLSVRQERLFFILSATPLFLNGEGRENALLESAPLETIEVPLLSETETTEFIESFSEKTGRSYVPEERKKLFHRTAGNPFLLSELLQPSGALEPFFRRILLSLSRREQEILESLSIYPEGASFPTLEQHLAPSRDGASILKGLCRKGVLKEVDSCLAFRYPILGEYLYDSLPLFFRQQEHRRAADLADSLDLPERRKEEYLAWHLQKSLDVGAELSHRLNALELALDYYDQLYPSFVDHRDRPEDHALARRPFYRELEQLTESVEKWSRRAREEEAAFLKLRLDYLRSRRFISGGEREKGLPILLGMIKAAGELNSSEYLLKGHMEAVHYGIQKEEYAFMLEHLKIAQELLCSPSWNGDLRKRGELLRLEGLYHYFVQQFESALNCLERSADLFSRAGIRQSGFLARAGALNYQGRTREAMGDSAGADKAYRDSISMVEGTCHKCLDLFYADYGRFLWNEGSENEAYRVLSQALVEFDLLGTHWKRPATEAILGLIRLGRGDRELARHHLANAQIYHRADRLSGEERLIGELSRRLKE